MITIEIEVPALPSSPKIHGIMAQSLESLACLFHDCEQDVNDAMTQGGEGKVTISHSIIIDMMKDKQTDKLSVSIKKGDEITCSLYHPDQKELFERNGTPRTVSKPDDNSSPALVGLPAPVEAIGMIVDAEIIEPSSEETPVIDSAILTKAYADSNVDPAEYPWCGVDASGDVFAFDIRPNWVEEDESWFYDEATYVKVLDLEVFVEPALWNYNGTEFAKVEEESSEEGGES